LSAACAKVFLSLRKEQDTGFPVNSYLKIYDDDIYAGAGALAGIMSAMRQYPQTAWFVLACDLPFITPDTIQAVIQGRDPQKAATAFRQDNHFHLEPLCTIYEPAIFPVLQECVQKGVYCPRKILLNAPVQLLAAPDVRQLQNINTPHEFDQAKAKLE
jgi:molybdopterin-guanine dinucleotide biosynthesis protein A